MTAATRTRSTRSVTLSHAAGSDASAPTTTAAAETTAPPDDIDPAAEQDAAEDALLVLSDFPAGWSEVPNAEPTEEEADYRRRTAECIGSEGPGIGDLGGAIASTGDFTSPSEETVAETVSFAPSVAEAEDFIVRFAAPDVAECFGEAAADLADGQLRSGMTLGEVTVARLNVSEVGDEAVAYRVTVPVLSGEWTVNLYADLVLVRYGRTVVGLAFQSELSPFIFEDTERYVALAAERLAAVS